MCDVENFTFISTIYDQASDFSRIDLVKNTNGDQFVIKYVYLNEDLIPEADSLMRLRSVKEVINLIKVCPTTEDGWALIMDKMDTDLYKFI